ncbi:MAG TPA: DUF4328 domain-containing protein [Rhizomicrobium sp.]|nr:DUF4328 domain-containing protein [Rhizomicrobium sp.]
MTDEKRYTYRDPRSITRSVVLASWATIAMAVVSIVSYGMQYIFLLDVQDKNFSSRQALVAAAHANDLRVQIVAGFAFVSLMLVLVTFLIWVYRTSANVHALGARNLNASAGFAVGTYFIPIVGLFLPPINMSEVFRASQNAADWPAQKKTPLVPLWWLFRLSSSILAIAIFFARDMGKSIDFLESLTFFLIIQHLVALPEYLLSIALISRIARFQGKQAELTIPPAAHAN